MSDWRVTRTIPTMAVPQLETGIRFYEVLGFTTEWRWPEHEPTHAGLIRPPDCSIMLAECDPWVCADVYFVVDDVRRCYEHVLHAKPWALAAQVAGNTDNAPTRALERPEPPEPKPYGLLDFHIVDPWGHQLSFGQPMGEADE